MRLTRLSRALLVAPLALPLSAIAAQTYNGVLLSADRVPVVGTSVLLTTPQGFVIDTAHTGRNGEFRVSVRAAGRYALAIRRIGYAPERTAPFTLDTDQIRTDTVIVAFTKLLRTVDVVVRDEVKHLLGIDVKQLGHRFITPEEVDSMRVSARGLPDFLHRAQVPGTWIEREGTDQICYKVQMQSGCAQLYVDGIKVESNFEIAPLDIESIILLRPNEGFTVTGGAGGSVLVYTRKTIARANKPR